MAAATQSNPTDGSRWILKVQPIAVEDAHAGWTLTIHRLPSVGFDTSRWLHFIFKDHQPTSKFRRRYAAGNYSCLNATSGSTLVARHAGTRQAAIATAASSDAMAANVTGSVGLTP